MDKKASYGWKDDYSFLSGAVLYKRGEGAAVTRDKLPGRSQWIGPSKGGDLGRWSKAANSLFAKGYEPQAFAMLCGFAAPLMKFHDTPEGGAILSLVKDEGRTSNIIGLECVESIWGRKEAIRLSESDALTPKTDILGALGNLPATWDELYNRDPEVIRQFVRTFTAGSHEENSWQTILVLTSAAPLTTILSVGGDSEYDAARVLELMCDIPKYAARKFDELRRDMRDGSGHAGDVYLKLITQEPVYKFLAQAIPQWTEEVWKRTKLADEQRFWVRCVASVIAASVLVNRLGILEFSTDRVTGWIMEAMQQQRTGKNGGKRDPVNAMIEFMNQHAEDTLVMERAFATRQKMKPVVAPRRSLFIRYEIANAKVYISKNNIHSWLRINNVSVKEFHKTLAAAGISTPGLKSMTLGACTEYSQGQQICYALDASHPAVKTGLREIEKVIPS